MGVSWTDYWEALQTNRAFPVAGLTLFIFGATFRWFEPLSRVAGFGTRSDPFASGRNWIAERRAAGDDAAARQAEERLRDQQMRLTRYGRAMMIIGVVIVALSVLLK